LTTPEDPLVAELRCGSVRAFDAAYARYRLPLFSFLFRLAGQRQLAEDLFQNTWLKLARGAARLEPGTDLKAWLFSVARNEYRSHCRWRSVDLRRLLGVEAEANIALASESGDLDLTRDRERAFARLPVADRELLLLLNVEGFEARSAAIVLGISYEALRQRLARARAHLSRLMQELET
jgi:RNA polymerase sigma-70 factor (ECF subfamily)